MMIEIRRALPEDARILSQIALSAKSHWNYPERWIEIWTPQLTFNPEYFVENESWVAITEDTSAGFYTIQVKDGKSWIENLWVLPQYMGLGIGRQLLLHAFSRSRQTGHLILQLEADPNAVGFYEKMGMQKIGERQSEIEGELRILPLMEMTL
jgi:ribosomal protein S18 acetylase RimI-like enzyme